MAGVCWLRLTDLRLLVPGFGFSSCWQASGGERGRASACLHLCVSVLEGILISKQCLCWCRDWEVWRGAVRKSLRISSVPHTSAASHGGCPHHFPSHLSCRCPGEGPFAALPSACIPSAELGTQPTSHEVTRRGEQEPCPVSRHI